MLKPKKNGLKNAVKAVAAVLSAALVLGAAAAAKPADAAEPQPGYYTSELTGLPISATLKSQRPIAVMVDNEKASLPHMGLTEADIVYEMMNSTANGRITRLMAIVKDWGKISQFGSIRSARPTNFMLAAEYNAILVHDGGPFYINAYAAQPYSNNLSGGFARFSNGKRTEYTEYVTLNSYTNPQKGQTYAGLLGRIALKGYSTNYNEYYQPSNLLFAPSEYTLNSRPDSKGVTSVALPFPHNSSMLTYNAATSTYDYSEYGKAHVDPIHNNARLTFENVLILKCSWAQLDKNGYMVYNILSPWTDGIYLTNGRGIPIKWQKTSETAHTVYMDVDTGTQLALNPGKTYIAIVPDDVWDQLVLK